MSKRPQQPNPRHPSDDRNSGHLPRLPYTYEPNAYAILRAPGSAEMLARLREALNELTGIHQRVLEYVNATEAIPNAEGKQQLLFTNLHAPAGEVLILLAAAKFGMEGLYQAELRTPGSFPHAEQTLLRTVQVMYNAYDALHKAEDTDTRQPEQPDTDVQP